MNRTFTQIHDVTYMYKIQVAGAPGLRPNGNAAGGSVTGLALRNRALRKVNALRTLMRSSKAVQDGHRHDEREKSKPPRTNNAGNGLPINDAQAHLRKPELGFLPRVHVRVTVAVAA